MQCIQGRTCMHVAMYVQLLTIYVSHNAAICIIMLKHCYDLVSAEWSTEDIVQGVGVEWQI